MVQKSGDNQLSLVVYPIIYRVLAPSQVGFLAGFQPSTVSWDQQIHFPSDHPNRFPSPVAPHACLDFDRPPRWRNTCILKRGLAWTTQKTPVGLEGGVVTLNTFGVKLILLNT